METSNFLLGLAVVGFLIISVLMILIVLVQRPQGGGLSGAFGTSSAGSGQTAFGAKTGDALTIATITIFVLFILTSIGINFVVKPPSAGAQQPEAESASPEGAAVPDQAATPPEADTGANTPAPETAPPAAGEQPAPGQPEGAGENPAPQQGQEPTPEEPQR
jgi:preprotein translocase subunit SecG